MTETGMQCAMLTSVDDFTADINHHTTPHHTTTVLQPFFLEPPGWAGARREPLDFMVQGKINRGRHTDHPAGHHSIQTNHCPPPPSPILFTGRMPFMPPNQRCQSTKFAADIKPMGNQQPLACHVHLGITIPSTIPCREGTETGGMHVCMLQKETLIALMTVLHQVPSRPPGKQTGPLQRVHCSECKCLPTAVYWHARQQSLVIE